VSQQGTINLSTSIQWAPRTLTFGPDGFRTTKTGTAEQSVCEAEAVALQADGWEGQVTQHQGPLSRITATISTLDPDNPDNDLVTRWDLDVQWSNVPAANSQAFRDYITANGGYFGTTFREIMAAVEQYRTDGTWTLLDALGSTPKAWAFDIITGETVYEPDAVLRRSNSYPPNTALTADWTDVRKVFTTSQLTSLSDPPSAIVGTLESGYWLKTSSGSSYGADGRYEVVTSWIYGSASKYPSHRYTYKT
jgi:hypothetical protein